MRDLPDFAKGRILVVGDVMLDRFWHGTTTRVSPEAPVPVVKVDDVDDRPGGCLLYTSPSPRDKRQSRMPSSA